MIREYWNQLCGIVRVWHESEGYDPVRWRQAGFLDPAAEAEYQRYVAEAGLREAEGRIAAATPLMGPRPEYRGQSATRPSAWS
ncbi:hypothetical protein OH768_39515 [Streptomyces sp. NBC_01622]|uniref:hypothetical protein n=1 Tax=Streptomyces sp. NBC_01622 TaxID=2975903 RepID=UPI0038655B00|nr:hypothetical protein OH768_39515 [Streptomyces sp. NBC_01622]